MLAETFVIRIDRWERNEKRVVWCRYLVPLPKTTPEGYRVLMYKLRDTEPVKFNHPNIAKTMVLFSDICTAEDGICPGYVIIGDPRGFSASHLTRINLSVLRVFMKYMQVSRPGRSSRTPARTIDHVRAIAGSETGPDERHSHCPLRQNYGETRCDCSALYEDRTDQNGEFYTVISKPVSPEFYVIDHCRANTEMATKGKDFDF